MKIGVIGRPSMTMGGGELVTLTLARECQARGHEVSLFMPPFDIPGDPDSNGSAELQRACDEEPFDITVTSSPLYDIPGIPLLWKKMALHPWLTFKRNHDRMFDRWFTTYGLYPVSEYWTRQGLSICHYFHSPIIADKCGPFQRYTVYPPVSALYALTEWTGGTDFPTASNSKLTRRRVHDEHGIKSEVIYPPVDVDTFSTPVTADADVPQGRYALLSGRFVPFKKFEIGLERLGAVVDDGLLDTIVVAGRLDNTEYYDSLQEQFPFAEFWTDVPSEQWLALHQQADVYVFSNYKEDFGLTGAEAAASGTPVVSPCGPGISELLADWEHGYILDQELSGLSNSIKDIFATSSTVEPSSKIREECSIEVFTDRMLSL